MPNCKVCGESVMTGVILHSDCYVKLIEENEKLKFKLEDWKHNSLCQAEIITELIKKNERLTTENTELKARLENQVPIKVKRTSDYYNSFKYCP